MSDDPKSPRPSKPPDPPAVGRRAPATGGRDKPTATGRDATLADIRRKLGRPSRTP